MALLFPETEQGARSGAESSAATAKVGEKAAGETLLPLREKVAR
jgi:hypothetical protein